MELLNKLYSIHAMSGQESAMRKYIKSYVKKMSEDVSVVQKDGNIYITKGVAESYPCLVAHLDQVQKNHSADFRVFETDGLLFGFSAENARLEGLGADDKNGIWIALKCLESLDSLKVAFFKEEEIGCGGSSIADMQFFEDCRYCIQADRKNGGDLITTIGYTQIASEHFIEDIMPIATRFGYKETTGMMTDVEALVDKGVGISCINISCGYHKPHTDQEHTNINELYNALEFVKATLSTLSETYAHKPSPGYQGWYGYDWYYEDEDVYIPSTSDYYDIESWLEAIFYYNYITEDRLDEIWLHIQADCETFGVSEEEFLSIYLNSDYCHWNADAYESA